MLLLNEIELINWISHEHTKITFKDNEKLLLEGKSGSGKSSVVEALLWSLYGEARAENKNLVRRGAKTATVSLKLEDGAKQIIVTRSTNNKGKNELAVTQSVDGSPFVHIDKTGIKDIQNWIENELLHSSYTLFTNSVAYPQDNTDNFVKATASERKDLLLEIVRAGDLDIFYEKARIILTTEETNATIVLSKIEGFEKNIKDFEPIASKVEEYQAEIEKCSSEHELLIASEKKVETEINDIKTIESQIKNKELLESKVISNMASKTVEINKKKEKIKQNLSIDIDTAKKNVEESKKVLEEISSIENKLKLAAETQSKINVYLSNKPTSYDFTNDIDRLAKQMIPLVKDSGKCPAGDLCPFTVPIRGQIAFLEEQIAEKKQKMKEGQTALDKWSTEFVLLPKAEDTSEDYKKYEELKKKYRELSIYESTVLRYDLSLKENEDLDIQIGELNRGVMSDYLESETIKKEIVDLRVSLIRFNIINLNNELSNIRLEVINTRNKGNEATRGHALALQARSNVLEARKSLVTLQKDVNDINERLECLKLIKEAFGSKGVKATIIDYIIPQLEERINELLGQLSDFKIKLDTQQTKVNEDGIKEGLWITVVNAEGEELPFDSFSGGEKVKITIAISEALSSLQNSIGFRIMDENIISLDKESTESFIEVLTKLQDRFPQLLMISHLEEIQDLFEDKITIIKVGGISKIKLNKNIWEKWENTGEM